MSVIALKSKINQLVPFIGASDKSSSLSPPL